MPKRSSSRKPDINQLAAAIVAQTTNGGADTNGKNPAAVALGRLGGLRGGRARAEKLTKERRREIARRAAQSRWSRRRSS